MKQGLRRSVESLRSEFCNDSERVTPQSAKSTSITRRRAARLSEGSAPRPLDYGLAYPGKKAEADILRRQTAESALCFSVNLAQSDLWRNRLYWADNLDALGRLLKDSTICGKVSLIYIDPPFASGASFASRGGNRAYDDAIWGGQYLEFLRERLVLLRELLAPTGSIYIHLDDKMAFPTKILADEIFGATNFRNWITRRKSSRKNSTTKQYGNISDYVMFYSKTDSYVWNRPYERWTEDWAAAEYQYIEAHTGRRYKKVPVHAPGTRNGETGKPWRGKLPPPGKHWQYPPRVLDEFDAAGVIYWSSTGNPRRKLYLDASPGVPVQDIWLDCRDPHNQNIEVTGYPTEKSLNLLRRIVCASSNPGDLVLDCFAGSGTTLVAAEETKRRWIGIDSSVEAIRTIVYRLGMGSNPMGDYVNSRKPKKGRKGVLRTNLDVFSTIKEEAALKEAQFDLWRNWFPNARASMKP